MPMNAPDALRKAETVAEAVKGMPEPEATLEITVRGFPGHLMKAGGKMITYLQWCQSEVERIGRIPGRSPRVVQGKSRDGEYRGKIMVVDDEFTLPEESIHTTRAQIARFHEKEKE